MSTQFDPLKITAPELHPTYLLEDYLRFPIRKITTYSGLDLVYYTNCSAGGEDNSKEILDVVAQTAIKDQCHLAHEWCCGHGAIGFELLHQGFCDRVSMSDKFFPAVISAEFTAAVNGWQDRVEVYHSEEFSSLPLIGADLIIADPPHYATDAGLEDYNQDGIRQSVDWDWNSHKILFSNLSGRLAPDGDLYLYESHLGSRPDIFKEMARLNGLQMIGCHDVSTHNYVIHFRFQS